MHAKLPLSVTTSSSFFSPHTQSQKKKGIMKITLKDCYTIKPAEPTPNMKLRLSECDQIYVITHVVTLYFYRPNPSYSFDSAVETLKTSLSKALVHFYPFAGRLRQISHDGDRLELECNSTGAELCVVESDSEIDDYGDFRPTPELRLLGPSLNYNNPVHELPLLLVQVTKFRCGGMSIGFAISHVLADGPAGLHFVKELARIARGLPLELPPFFDRITVWDESVRDNQQQRPLSPPPLKFDHVEFKPVPLLIGKSDNIEQREKETAVEMLKLTKIEVEKIRSQANHGGYNKSDGHPYSRYEAMSGYIWRCACKARKHESQQPTNVRIVVDCRNRVDPPLPQGYFGNAIFPTMATSTAGELMEKPLNYASSKIREATQKMTDEYIKSAIEFVKTQSDLSKFRVYNKLGSPNGSFYGNPNIAVISWISLPLYGTDFGWGKEIHMGNAALAYDGQFMLLSGADGDGSLVVALRLQVEHLDSFKRFFYEDI